jgi:hypothetical protein
MLEPVKGLAGSLEKKLAIGFLGLFHLIKIPAFEHASSKWGGKSVGTEPPQHY